MLRVTGICAGNSLVTSEFPAQRASIAKNISIWWCHHDIPMMDITVTNLAADMLYLCIWVHGMIWFVPDEIYLTVAFNCHACSFRGSCWHLGVHECVFSNWSSLVQVARCCLRGIQQLTKPILACHQYLLLTLYSKENRKLVNTHSTDSSVKHSSRHSTQTQTSEVRWAARSSGHWVVTSMFA